MRARLSKPVDGLRAAADPFAAALRLALLACLGLGLAACTVPTGAGRPAPAPVPASAPEPASEPRADDGPPMLALLVPQGAEGGTAARLADALAASARLAADRAPVRLRIYDTAGQAERAAAMAEQAIAEGADILLGPLFAASTAAVGEVAAGAGIVVLSFSNDSDVAGGPVWVTGYAPEREAARILRHAAAEGLVSVGLFRPDTAYGDKAARGAEGSGAAYLSVDTAYERSNKGIERASGAFAAEARAVGLDAVLLPAGGSELQSAALFINYNGVDPQQVRFLGTAKWNTRATFDEPSLQGGWFAAPDPDLASDYAARYRAAHGQTPPLLAHLGHDAVTVAAAVLEAARGPDGLRRELLRSRGFDGVLGPLGFAPDQVADRALAVLEVGSGRFRVREGVAGPPAGGS